MILKTKIIEKYFKIDFISINAMNIIIINMRYNRQIEIGDSKSRSFQNIEGINIQG